ncbi:hypothetical protein BDZ85DRAFT_269999 [Elsinoe ampelina]|uniref:N-acetyltransferase domain-containing protein n=1 Tax=Elsinoe ampelina TaxID=302913 RepID=A0A6A6FZK2_9PEZI|nr:hypothetical protein BDZ85DRAFT_269999 [Elsinoe ampelina]
MSTTGIFGGGARVDSPGITPKPLAPDATLILVDLDDPKQAAIMLAQRKICGWGADNIRVWHKYIKSGERAMFWIALPSSSAAATSVPRSDALDCIPSSKDGKEDQFLLVGHTALDWIDLPVEDHFQVDDTLTAEDGSVLTISSLCIMPEFKAYGLGTWSMQKLEEMAQQKPYGSPNCRAIAVNTLSDRHVKGGIPGPEGLDMFPNLGIPIPDRSNVGWFEKMGYVRYKEEKRYEAKGINGNTVYIWAVFLRKELPPKQ